MKLTISKNELNDAIQQVAKAISSRPAIPILGGIKIDVTHQGVTLTASDTEISIQSFIPVERDNLFIAHVDKPGSVVLPAKFFVEIIKKLPSDNVEIQVGAQFQTMIRSGSSDIQMVGLDPEEFPILPSIEENGLFQMPGDLLKTMIRQTVLAASTNEQTAVLTGVLWTLNNQQLKFIATDRHRLASRNAHTETDPEYRFSNVIIAAKTLVELSKLVPEQNALVDIVVADNQVMFKLGNVLFYTRMLDGMYPDTSKIIPQTYKTELVVDTKNLMDAIDRAYLMSREEKTNIVRLITLDDNSIEISSSSTELGRVTEQIDAKKFEGEPLRISFNSKFMLDVLKVIDSEQIFIGFTGAMSPIIIKPTDHSYNMYVILPYRTTT
ncbi:DNA polymerase III subunit beta [Paenibacillus algorifonticola]|uniref:Beta sliding clamp n=2 Tax=Paenibacillus TaxID=44249 RepID=A0A1I2DTL3_9BACL|nr:MULTISPECIES: DNA polymerase III subunit beta [Paenibacillus]ANY66563.1 DNA polymerase III subunit beta [Paenibacillus sp. BIHB 4019]KQO10600.1 DNA polymerase III subunit beta [Paenibacillus sp. Leaf72]SFE83260.1 DNA polymerase-3 subunit beta [Paenibacillus algorifonticola]